MSAATTASCATLLGAEEASLLGPFIEGYAREYGAPPTVTALSPEPPLDVAPAGLCTLTLPERFEPKQLLGGIGHFSHRPALVDHMRRLGYRWSDAGRITTMPTPATLNALLSSLPVPPTLRVAYLVESNPSVSLGAWLRLYMDGCLPVHVAEPPFYAADRAAAVASWVPWARREGRHTIVHKYRRHYADLCHDLSVHGQNYHLVPRASLRALGDRIRAALPERAATWDTPGAGAPLTLAYFYDNDLNRYCYAVWCRCESPSDFAPTFAAEPNFRQLQAALDVRIRETNEGLGDSESGDSKDLPPLTPVEIDIRSIAPGR